MPGSGGQGSGHWGGTGVFKGYLSVLYNVVFSAVQCSIAEPMVRNVIQSSAVQGREKI
jgi:hypothetical protein